MRKIILLILLSLLVLASCQSSRSKNDLSSSKQNSASRQRFNCENAKEAKEVLYSVKGDIKNFSQIAQCYNQIGKHQIAGLFYQKSLDENKSLYQSMLGLAKINDLSSLPLKAKANYETLYNQIAQFNKGNSRFYLDYALFSLYYRDSRASSLALRRISQADSVDQYKLVQAYQKVILGDRLNALKIWNQISWNNIEIDAYRAFHIAHLAHLLKDQDRLKLMIKKFDLTIPDSKRILSQRYIGE